MQLLSAVEELDCVGASAVGVGTEEGRSEGECEEL